MPDFYGLYVSEETLKAYEEEDLDYKAQARKIICERLGYNPSYQLSARCELCLRDALKRCKEGKITITSLEDIISFQADVAQIIMMEYAQAGTS